MRGFAIGPFTDHPVPGEPLDPRRDGLRHPDAAGGTVVHTGDFKFDHTPPDGVRADLGLIAEIGNRGRGVPALRLDARRAGGLHPVGDDGGGVAAPARRRGERPRDRRHLRQQHRARAAGARRRVRATVARWWRWAAAWSRTPRSRSSSATWTRAMARWSRKDQLQRIPKDGAGGHDHRLAGRADVRADPDEQPRPPQRDHRARRHGDRVRLAHPRQRGGGRAARSTTSSRRGRWSTTSR